MKTERKSRFKQRTITKSKNVSARSISQRKNSRNSCFSNLPKESGRLTASFYAKK